MKMSLLLSFLIALCLTSCASSPAKDASRATDLELVKLGVDALTAERPIPGDLQHLHQARDTDQVWVFAGNAEEGHWGSEQDKVRTRNFVTQALAAIERSRQATCPWYGFRCRRDRERTILQQSADKANLELPDGDPTRPLETPARLR